MKYNKDLERKSAENNIIFKIGCGYGYGTVSVVGNATRLRPIPVSGIGRYCRYRFRISIGNNFPDTSTDTDRPRTARRSYGCIMKNNRPSLMRNIKQIKATTSCL